MTISATRPRERSAVTVKETPHGIQLGFGASSVYILSDADAYALSNALIDRLEGVSA